MRGIARIYEHVTPEIRQRVLGVLEERWHMSLAALTAAERARLVSWFPHLRATSPPLPGADPTTAPHDLRRLEKPSSLREGKGLVTCTDVLVDLLRRYLNRPDLLGPLVDVVRRISDPAEDGGETVMAIEARTASPDYIRRRLSDTDIAEVTRAYLSGTTARALAEAYGVSLTTIKNKLRERGAKRSRKLRVDQVH